MKIAMWSGPRNLSTACMYSFGNRADCAVTDEPFYAAYLAATGADHPMRDQIIASQPNDPNAVEAYLLGPDPNGRAIWYQKHMTHHMVEGFPLGWMKSCANVFLIRHPARVIASYAAKREAVTLGDIGLREQLALYEFARSLGQDPIVIDSSDIRTTPGAMMRALCDALGIDFDPAMLRWAAGPRAEDGVWAKHWYGAVHQSTGFSGAEGPIPDLDPAHHDVLAEALPLYTALAAKALSPAVARRQ
ncbi:MAG: HAD family hydrolase [Pseudomonadota bacterium]